MLKRIGSELLADSDKLGKRKPLPNDCLAFSHGRAALSWIIQKWEFKSALICAYTCPVVPDFFVKNGINLDFFDIGEWAGSVLLKALSMEGPRLILIPALFGQDPWIDRHQLEESLDDCDMVLIDAAQTAFGHLHYEPPVFSCPRKRVAMNDGAVLRLPGGEAYRDEVAALPVNYKAFHLKRVARSMWAVDNDAHALTLHNESELALTEENSPSRMTDESLDLLEQIDQSWHIQQRKKNLELLSAFLGKAFYKTGSGNLFNSSNKVFTGVPFSMPLLVPNPDRMIEALKGERIYLTRLWPNSRHDPTVHPRAAAVAEHLVSLPIDQRHDVSDMERLAKAVTSFMEEEAKCLLTQSGSGCMLSGDGEPIPTKNWSDGLVGNSNRKKMH